MVKQILDEIFTPGPSDVEVIIQMRLERRAGGKRAGKKMRRCGQESSALVSS